ncbi:MAG: DUF1848 domain-containing protein [Candidatus Onthomorpha sp.]
MAWDRVKITTDNGDVVDAQAPIIVSASRSTDIPAFYADWFFDRLKKGYCAWTNPFNGVPSYVSFEKTRFIVFWSKNPKPLIPYLHFLKEKRIKCYIQFTLNDYVEEGLERGVPKLEERIDTFKKLVDILGKGRVVWRFDPLILTDNITISDLLSKIEYIGDRLYGYTEKLVFSYADIASYRKVRANLNANNINYIEFASDSMNEFAKGLTRLNLKWGYKIATCGEKIDLDYYGIEHNRCVDDELITRIAYDDPILMQFLNMSVFTYFGKDFEPLPEGAIELTDTMYAIRKKDNKDKGQRQTCECISSKDIGQYNTCPHLCEYCYANSSKETAVQNWKKHKENPFGENILGK